MNTSTFLVATALLPVVFAITSVGAQAPSATVPTASEPLPQLQVPALDYRREWVLLGSFSILADEPEEGAKELHVVYTQPESVDAFLKTGAFPAGAVLVKDVFGTSTEALTTGTSSYADTLVGRFVMVKDQLGNHSGANPLWGDGWGWAFFEGAETQTTVTTDYRQDCLACHEPARSQDLIYTQGYPILRR